MNIETIEDDLITKLTADIGLATAEIRSFPDDPAEYNLVHPGGAILVRYDQSIYPEPIPNRKSFLIQEEVRHQWIITVMQKSLKLKDGHQGVYGLVESVRTSLSGYTITSQADFSILWPTGVRFVSENEGTWVYQISFAHTAPETE